MSGGPFVFDGDFYVQNHGDWYRSIDKGASWVLYTMPDIVAERDRLAAENEALCAFVDAYDTVVGGTYERMPDGEWKFNQAWLGGNGERLMLAHAAIEPILAARRERG